MEDKRAIRQLLEGEDLPTLPTLQQPNIEPPPMSLRIPWSPIRHPGARLIPPRVAYSTKELATLRHGLLPLKRGKRATPPYNPRFLHVGAVLMPEDFEDWKGQKERARIFICISLGKFCLILSKRRENKGMKVDEKNERAIF